MEGDWWPGLGGGINTVNFLIAALPE